MLEGLGVTAQRVGLEHHRRAPGVGSSGGADGGQEHGLTERRGGEQYHQISYSCTIHLRDRSPLDISL